MSEFKNSFVRKAVTPVAAVILATGCTVSSETSEAEAPDTSDSAVDRLNEMLDVQSLEGVVLTDWRSCPQGLGAQTLPDEARVNAYLFTPDPNGRPNSDDYPPTIEIENITRYQDDDKILGWCGSVALSLPGTEV